jgi:S-adenosylmethionine uptake transporter
MIAAMGAFRITDAGLKIALETMPMGQVLVVRTLPSLLILGFAAALTGALRPPARQDRMPVLGATLAEVAGNWFMLASLATLPFALIIASLQIHPLAMAAFGALVLSERIGPRRWLAIMIGFGGVLLILRPGGETTTLAGFGLLAGVVISIMARDLAARFASNETPSLFIALITCAGAGVFGGVLSLGETWVSPSTPTLLVLLGTGVSISIAYVLAIAAIRTGDLGIVAPFRYSALLWGGVLGYFLFSEVPDGPYLLGAVIVVTAGLFVFWRGRAATP